MDEKTRLPVIIVSHKLKTAVKREAEEKGVSMAAIVRFALMDRYELSESQDSALPSELKDSSAGSAETG